MMVDISHHEGAIVAEHSVLNGSHAALKFRQGKNVFIMVLPERMAACAEMIAGAFNAHMRPDEKTVFAQTGQKPTDVAMHQGGEVRRTRTYIFGQGWADEPPENGSPVEATGGGGAGGFTVGPISEDQIKELADFWRSHVDPPIMPVYADGYATPDEQPVIRIPGENAITPGTGDYVE